MRMRRGSERARWITGAVLVAGGLTLIANYASGTAACGTENSGCARAGPPRPWRGRVVTAQGEPASRAVVKYYFDSNRRSGHPTRNAVTVVSDDHGRYCLRWPTEASTAFVAVSSATSGQRLVLVSPDATSTPGASYLIARLRDPNLTVTNRGWRPVADATATCVTHAPPWNRTEELKSNWRYRVLIYLPLLAIALAVAGTGRRRSTELGRWATRSSEVLAAGGVVLYVLVWVTHTV